MEHNFMGASNAFDVNATGKKTGRPMRRTVRRSDRPDRSGSLRIVRSFFDRLFAIEPIRSSLQTEHSLLSKRDRASKAIDPARWPPARVHAKNCPWCVGRVKESGFKAGNRMSGTS
jgi:hypothetical protein